MLLVWTHRPHRVVGLDHAPLIRLRRMALYKCFWFDLDRWFTIEWPRRIAHLHRSAGGRLLSERIWFSHCFLGDVRDVSKSDQEDVQERCRSGAEELDVLRCPSFPSLAKWSNRLLRLPIIIRPMSGGCPVRSAMSLLQKQYHRIPRIFLWHFMWKDSRLSVSEAS